MVDNWWILGFLGLFSGLLAGLFGIGGGTILVPILVALKYSFVQAVGTSSLVIVITSLSGSLQNWRMGYLDFKRVTALAFPSLITVQFGVYLTTILPSFILKVSFGIFLIINIFLGNFKNRLLKQTNSEQRLKIKPTIARIFTGGTAGLLAGLFGIGGGIIMVPLQMLFLGENIKIAIQTSLGVVVITGILACVGHSFQGNVLLVEGIILGIGGLIGAQISSRYLPKLPDKIVSFCFYIFLGILSVYIFWEAWNSY